MRASRPGALGEYPAFPLSRNMGAPSPVKFNRIVPELSAILRVLLDFNGDTIGVLHPKLERGIGTLPYWIGRVSRRFEARTKGLNVVRFEAEMAQLMVWS